MSSPVTWLEDGTPRCPQFDDIYRSTGIDGRGGLEQARHVFLAGCGLLRGEDGEPAQWSGRERWQLLETGFGLGLNFLACWQAWREDPQRPQRLFFTSVEAWPVRADDIRRSCAPFPELADLAEQLARQWQAMLPGVHRLVFEGGRVQLTLGVGLARDWLPTLDTLVDSVFLDGFSPQVNPELWELPLLKAVARLSRPGTRLATWTIARALRDGLVSAGFEVEKAPGLPPKRDCLRARFAPRWQPKTVLRGAEPPQTLRRAIVVGAGLSGSAAAYSLALRGWSVEVLDQADAPAAGASGLPAGLVAPHVSPDDAALSRLSRAGVRLTLARAAELLSAGSDWAASGVLEHRVEGKHSLPRTESWQAWGLESSCAASTQQLEQAGLAPDTRALWHGLSGWLRPAQLVRAQLDHPAIQFRGGCQVARIEPLAEGGWRVLDRNGAELGRAPQLVIASAYDTRALLREFAALPLNALRGQISWGALDELPEGARALLPAMPVNGHGSFIHGPPGPDGRAAWITGSTFERGATRPELKPGDQDANRDKLLRLLPALGAALAPTFEPDHAWAGVRCTLPDRVPAVGAIAPGLQVCAGMGARGLTLSVLCGELIAANLEGEPWPVERRLAQALLAGRFAPKFPAAD